MDNRQDPINQILNKKNGANKGKTHTGKRRF